MLVLEGVAQIFAGKDAILWKDARDRRSGLAALMVLEGRRVHGENVVVAHVVADFLGRHGVLHVGAGD